MAIDTAAWRACVVGPALVLSLPVLAGDAIQDNSFLIEEAYNQGRGIVQHISTFNRFQDGGDWISTFTQEWPVPDVRHQLSFTLPALGLHDDTGELNRGLGDIAINYRYQAVGDGDATVAVAPRASLQLPTGDATLGLGVGGWGAQINLPVSVVLHERVVAHFNTGVTWVDHAEDAVGDQADLTAYTFGQSVVGLLTERFNVLVELIYTSSQEVTGPDARERVEAFFVNPGIRWAHNLKNGLQIVPGISVPIGLGPSSGTSSVFFYLSFEHPFR